VDTATISEDLLGVNQNYVPTRVNFLKDGLCHFIVWVIK
jgi:hypothetical protein